MMSTCLVLALAHSGLLGVPSDVLFILYVLKTFVCFLSKEKEDSFTSNKDTYKWGAIFSFRLWSALCAQEQFLSVVWISKKWICEFGRRNVLVTAKGAWTPFPVKIQRTFCGHIWRLQKVVSTGLTGVMHLYGVFHGGSVQVAERPSEIFHSKKNFVQLKYLNCFSELRDGLKSRK